MHIYYSPAYTAAAFGFDTTRKATWIAASLRERPIGGVRLVEPAPLTEQQLLDAHAPAYITAVRTGRPRHLAESSGFPWDPEIWRAVCASNGGVVAAALQALRSGEHAGSLSSGLHHARRDSGAAFCTFNGLALAARAAIDAGAQRILVLDLDAHIGDGTIHIVRSWPEVVHVDLSVCAWSAPAADPARASFDSIRRANDYLPTLERRLEACRGFELCLYNAGMDPHEDSDIGGLEGMTTGIMAARERMVFEWASAADVPVAFVLAGGYAVSQLSREALVELHRLTVEQASLTSSACSTSEARAI